MDAATALVQVSGVSCMLFAAVGSGLGSGVAGMSAVGAWKRCYLQNKPAPFQLAVFVGAPLSQTIYGMILMLLINGKTKAMTPDLANMYWIFLVVAGVLGGMVMGLSAYLQGRAAAGACDAFAETGKGFTNDLMVLGVIETVALFVMVFVIICMGIIPAA